MGTPPNEYSTHATLPLPTDAEIGPELVKDLQQSHNLNVSRMLAGTADMYPGAKALVQAVFQAKDVDPRLRELIILRSAYLLDCPYEWQANVVMAKNTGCTQADIDAVTVDGPVIGINLKINLVMLATDELTKTGTLSDDTLQQLRRHYDDTICRKLVLIIAWFNLLARFLNGCRVPLETGDKLGKRTSPLG
jgi:alkylhydroperoxidase family enzyme